MQPKSSGRDSSSGGPTRLHEVVGLLDADEKTVFTEILLLPSLAHQLSIEVFEGEQNWTTRLVRGRLISWIQKNPLFVPNWASFKDLVN